MERRVSEPLPWGLPLVRVSVPPVETRSRTAGVHLPGGSAELRRAASLRQAGLLHMRVCVCVCGVCVCVEREGSASEPPVGGASGGGP